MKWFQFDSNTPNDPCFKRAFRRLQRDFPDPSIYAREVQRTFGVFGLLCCYIGVNGKQKQPGWAITEAGAPLPFEDMAAECWFFDQDGREDVNRLIAWLDTAAADGLIDRDRWQQRIVVVPYLAGRVDTYTRRVVGDRPTDVADVRTPSDTRLIPEQTVLQSSPTVQDSTEQNRTEQRKRPRARALASEPSPRFERVWAIYPQNKGGKAEAVIEWNRLGIDDKLDADDWVDRVLIPAVLAYARTLEPNEPRFTLHLCRFLKRQRWKDVSGFRAQPAQASLRPATVPFERRRGVGAAPDKYAALHSGGDS